MNPGPVCSQQCLLVYLKLLRFPETKIFAHENGWLEDVLFFFGGGDFAYFQGRELLVSGRVPLRKLTWLAGKSPISNSRI